MRVVEGFDLLEGRHHQREREGYEDLQERDEDHRHRDEEGWHQSHQEEEEEYTPLVSV